MLVRAVGPLHRERVLEAVERRRRHPQRPAVALAREGLGGDREAAIGRQSHAGQRVVGVGRRRTIESRSTSGPVAAIGDDTAGKLARNARYTERTRVEVALAAVEDLEILIRTHSLPADTRARVSRARCALCSAIH